MIKNNTEINDRITNRPNSFSEDFELGIYNNIKQLEESLLNGLDSKLME
jgi:hypothetical protein